jgi:hypothetical protein
VAKVSGISKGTFYIAMGGICIAIAGAALLASYLFTSNELLGVVGAFLALYGLTVAAAPVYLEAYVFNRFKRATHPMPTSVEAKGLSKGACYVALGGLSVSLAGAALLATYFFFVPNTSLGVAGALMTVLGLFIAVVTVVLEVYIFSLFSRFKRVPSRHNENSEEKEPSTTKANPIKATCLISGPKKLSTIEIPANATAKPRLKS